MPIDRSAAGGVLFDAVVDDSVSSLVLARCLLATSKHSFISQHTSININYLSINPSSVNYWLANYQSSKHCLVSSALMDSKASESLLSSAKPSVVTVIPRAQVGFTLIEILVVIVILSVFAGMISLSVGSSDSRKNRAFYEHLIDSLDYVRLLSAERMQPMGLSLQADKQGQVTPVIVTLSNPYSSYQTPVSANNDGTQAKNSMELSANISGRSATDEPPTPTWQLEPEVDLPELPVGVSLTIQSLDVSRIDNRISAANDAARSLQPWFSGQSVPQVLWFGTGQATPVTIEVRYDSRLVGEAITIMPDGSMMVGQSQ